MVTGPEGLTLSRQIDISKSVGAGAVAETFKKTQLERERQRRLAAAPLLTLKEERSAPVRTKITSLEKEIENINAAIAFRRQTGDSKTISVLEKERAAAQTTLTQAKSLLSQGGVIPEGIGAELDEFQRLRNIAETAELSAIRQRQESRQQRSQLQSELIAGLGKEAGTKATADIFRTGQVSSGSLPFISQQSIKDIGLEKQVQSAQQRQALAQIGTPVFSGGQLAGFETGRQTVPLANLSESQLKSLEGAGILKFKQETVTQPPTSIDFASGFKSQVLVQPEQTKTQGFISKAADTFSSFNKFKTPLSTGILDLIPDSTKQKAALSTLEFASTEPKSLTQISKIKNPLKGGLELTKFAALEPFRILDISLGKSKTTLKTKGGELLTTSDTGVLGAGKRLTGAAVFATGVGAGVGEVIVDPTPAGVALDVAGIDFIGKAPRLVQKGIFAGVGGLGATTTLDKDNTLEERLVGGALGFGGTAGVFFPTTTSLAIKQQKQQVKGLVDQGVLSKEAGKQLESGINLQRFLRRQKDVPLTRDITTSIPADLTIAEKEAFATVLFEPDARVFGSQAVRLRGLQETGGDIDIFVKDAPRVIDQFEGLLKEVSRKEVTRTKESIGFVDGDKAFDIKGFERLREFPLAEKPSVSKEGVQITKLSEQFSRTLSGTIELRKGGKDIGSAILSSRAIIEQSAKEVDQISFPPIKALRQIRQAKAETRLIELEKVVPELDVIVTKVGQAKIVELGKPFKRRTQAPTSSELILSFFPKSKRGQIGGTGGFDNVFRGFDPSGLSSSLFRSQQLPSSFRAPLTGLTIGLTSSGTGRASSRISPSRLSFTSSGLSPSILKVTPTLTPSDLLSPSKVPRRTVSGDLFTFTPSNFTTPKIPTLPITPPTTTITPVKTPDDPFKFKETFVKRKSDDRKRKPKSRAKKKRRATLIRPSFTGIVTAQGLRAPTTGREFEFAAEVSDIGGVDIGISPIALRGTRTGFKKSKSKKVKKTKKKKKKKPKNS